MPGEAAERPRLAPSTWLVGQLDESALANPPWAVERAKLGYIQMGELAYHVAEHADGERTVGEIAHAVTLALGRPVSVGDVQALIHTVLVPRGVMLPPGGFNSDDELALDDHASVEPTTRRNGHSPGTRSGTDRGVGREMVIGPAGLERLAAVLMWLLWPPIMLVVAGVSLAVLTWLFVFHGLAASALEVLTLPLLLPLALVLAVLAMGLQAIGPMVALYCAGAQIERLRITLSLRQPRIALDVAEDYGLSRWARLTVDVSGVYLQLAAALVLCLVGMFNGAEFLFLSVTLLTLNILRLLLPFGRPGADRLLSDLLLVSEPLLYAEQALERVTPGNHAFGRLLPPLKRWGWVTIGLYLVASALILVLVGLTVLGAAPTVIATMLAALVVHISDTLEALGDRDVAGFFWSLLQATVLALTSFVLAVAIVVGVGKLLAGAWTWSQGSGRRRLVGGVGALVALLAVLLFWLPIPRPNPSGGRTFRPLLGSPYRAMSPISRGTLLDVFEPTQVDEAPASESGQPPSVTTDVGTGGVGGPLPGEATSGAGTVGAGGAARPGSAPAPAAGGGSGPAVVPTSALSAPSVSAPAGNPTSPAGGSAAPAAPPAVQPAANPATGTGAQPVNTPSTQPTLVPAPPATIGSPAPR